MQRAKLLKKESFLTLRVSLFCGEALPTKVAKSWLGAAPNSRLDNLYGPTETTIAITRFTVTEATLNEGYNIIPIGMPFPNQKACLLDERGNLSPLDSGAVGELLFNGSQVTIGYWCDESAATDKFSNTFKDIGLDYTFYRTGDLARYDDYCGFQFLGRLDDQVKVRGHRVELLEVEGVVRKVSNAASVAVLAWPKTEMGAEGLIAFIESEALEEVEDIRIECTKLLPSYMVPRKFICLDNIPRNTNNKIDKEKLFNMLDRGAV